MLGFGYWYLTEPCRSAPTQRSAVLTALQQAMFLFLL